MCRCQTRPDRIHHNWGGGSGTTRTNTKRDWSHSPRECGEVVKSYLFSFCPRYNFEGRYLGSLPDLAVPRKMHACSSFLVEGEEVNISSSCPNIFLLFFKQVLLVAGGWGYDKTTMSTAEYSKAGTQLYPAGYQGPLSSTECFFPSRKKWTREEKLPRWKYLWNHFIIIFLVIISPVFGEHEEDFFWGGFCPPPRAILSMIIPVQMHLDVSTSQKCCLVQSKSFLERCMVLELLAWTRKWLLWVESLTSMELMSSEIRYCVEFLNCLSFVLLLSPGSWVRGDLWVRNVDKNWGP